MKKIIVLAVLFLSQTIAFSQSRIDLDIDYACFALDSSQSMLELYYNLYTRKLTKFELNGHTAISAKLLVALQDSLHKPLFDKNYTIEANVTEDSVGQQSFIGRLQYAIKPGKYFLQAAVFDAKKAGSQSDTIKQNLAVEMFKSDRFALSDIQLASSVKSSEDTSSMFYKNTYEVIPNPSMVFGTRLPALFYYCELYNLKVNPGTEYLKLETILFDSQNKPVMKKTKLVPRSNDDIVEAGALNISKLSSGSYTFAIVLVDSIKKIGVMQSKKIYLYFPDRKDTAILAKAEDNYMASEFAVMSEEELNDMFAQSKYIAKKDEIKKWAGLSDLDAKRKFMHQFWSVKEKSVEGNPGDYKRKYFERVAYANEKFSGLKRKGWQSDRGRVYIVYGEPSEIERFPNEIDKKPYEIWHYNSLEGGAEFMFGDLNGFSEYQLLNSTLRGELRDDNWMNRLQQL